MESKKNSTLCQTESEHRSFTDAPCLEMDYLFAGYEGSYRGQEADWGDDTGSEVAR